MEHSQWQSLLTLGNDCFQENQWSQAEFFYTEAYDLLIHAYRSTPLSAEILMAWICTCHNLSALHEARGDLPLALKFLKIPNEYLSDVTQSTVPCEDAKLIAYKCMSLTMSPILLFSKKYPVCDDCRSKKALQIPEISQLSSQSLIH